MAKIKEIHQCDKCKTEFEVAPGEHILYQVSLRIANWPNEENNGFGLIKEGEFCKECLLKLGFEEVDREYPQEIKKKQPTTAEQLYDILTQIVAENAPESN